MNPDADGCFWCHENRRDIKRLVSQGRHDEWAGRPVGAIREQIAELRRRMRECDHRLTEPQRAAAAEPEPARTVRTYTRKPRPLRDVRTGTLTVAPPDLKPGQVRCPACRNGVSLTSGGFLRKHRDLFGHDCYAKAP